MKRSTPFFHFSRHRAYLALLAVACWLPHGALGDEFILTNGARFRGEWLNWDDRPPSAYVIRTGGGIRMTLDPRRVARVVRHSPARERYEQRAPNYADTTDAQWELAQWCRENGLFAQRRRHLQRVVELDPQHVRARRALGYFQLGGGWVTQDQVLEERGYVFYRGRWRLPQQVDLLEKEQRVSEAQRRWFLDLKRLDSQLRSRRRAEALAQVRAIRDPHAVPALARLVRRSTELAARLLYVEALGRIPGPPATAVLVETALNDHDQEVFHACVDQLVPRATPEVVKVFAQALGDASNRRVNRAGYALGQFQEPSTIQPLIEALVTTHDLVLSGPSGNSAGIITTGFIRQEGQTVGTPLSVRGGPVTRRVRLSNRGVLGALEQLAGVSFGYDQRAWREWYTRHRSHPAEAALNRIDS